MLVSQQAMMSLEVSDRAYVMDSGNIVMSGNARDLLVDPRVQEAYLGA